MKKLSALLFCALSVSGSLNAGDLRDGPHGYATDSDGNVLLDSYGNCVKSGSWTPEMAKVAGCDGYQASTAAEIIKGEPIEDGVVALEIPFSELFESDQTDLDEEGTGYLDKLAGDMKDSLTNAYNVTVVGHTDSTGSDEHNMKLSKARAESVADYLASIGVDRSKIRTLAAGETNPIASNDTEEGRAMNRRAELVVVGQPRALDRMVMPSATLFDRRSASLSESGEQMLRDSTEMAKETFKKALMIEVVGHTDDVGTEEYNNQLSLERAEAVAAFLQDIGVESEKILITGAGKSAPVASNSTEEGRQENRRVEILMVGRARAE